MRGNLRKRLAAFSGVILLTLCGSTLTGPPTSFGADKLSSPVPSSNPFSGDSDAIRQGHRLYFRWCVQCHGKKADGRSPRFGQYARDLRKFGRGYSQFFVTVLNGRLEKKMPRWVGVLSGEEIAQIGAYLETLAIEGARWKDY